MTSTDPDDNHDNIITYSNSDEIRKYFSSKPNRMNYLLITIQNESYHTSDGNNELYYDTIIDSKTSLIINENSTFVINRSLKNYGSIINNGHLILDSIHYLSSYFENNGQIINNGTFEVYGCFSNKDEGTLINTNIIRNYGIFNNDGIIDSKNTFNNEGIFNNNRELFINGDFTNEYIVHNRMLNTETNSSVDDKINYQTNDQTNNKFQPQITNIGKIINRHILHNESLITNINSELFINSNILINTGTITNCKYNDKLIY